MRRQQNTFSLVAVFVAQLCAATANAAAPIVRVSAPIEIELATQPGLQITAPQEWLQLLAKMGQTRVRVRGLKPGDEPAVNNRGTDDRPRYHVLGILTARGELFLPGKMFRRSDRAKLKDYFDQLAADGVEGVTAPRGEFGLTDKQFTKLRHDLSRPIIVSTQGKPLREVVELLEKRLSHPVMIAPQANVAITRVTNCKDEVQGLSTGTGLAILLRGAGLALGPEKKRGEPVQLLVRPIGEKNSWPVGYEPVGSPRKVAPELFEFLNAQIAGYSLREAINAIQPRLGMNVYFDQVALTKYSIDPDELQVTFPQSRTYYKRILDRVISQARMQGQVRIDESGTTFYWITRK